MEPMEQEETQYTRRYAYLVLRHLGRQPLPTDGLSDTQIGQAEAKLGLRFPDAVRNYYQVAGNLSELNKTHNRLFDLSELCLEDNYLIFMEENQAVAHWGIKTNDLAQPDPEVWQRANSTPPEWYSEKMTFSDFMIRMVDWQLGYY